MINIPTKKLAHPPINGKHADMLGLLYPLTHDIFLLLTVCTIAYVHVPFLRKREC